MPVTSSAKSVVVSPTTGALYFVDTRNFRVRRIDTDGVITTVVGGAMAGFEGDGEARFGGDGGDPIAASLKRPWGITFDGAGNLFIADTMNNRIRMVTP